jgi:hypothetical protein
VPALWQVCHPNQDPPWTLRWTETKQTRKSQMPRLSGSVPPTGSVSPHTEGASRRVPEDPESETQKGKEKSTTVLREGISHSYLRLINCK